MSRREIEITSSMAVASGAGMCDMCGGIWKQGPYCPTCGVLANDGSMGRCLDCGQNTEYVGDRWRHVNADDYCFLIPVGHGHPDVHHLAFEFARILNEWLTPNEMLRVVTMNLREEMRRIQFSRTSGRHICRTHDFCDANMAMVQAFHNVVGRAPDGNDDNGDARLWRAAWGYAKRHGFKIEHAEIDVAVR